MTRRLFASVAFFAFASTAIACAPKKLDDGPEGLTGDGSIVDDESGLNFDAGDPFADALLADGPKPPCTGLQCQQVDCPGGAKTTVTGTVYAPNGKLPLYNVIVYVPNSDLSPMTKGVTCDKCGSLASGNPIVTTLSNHEGKFSLENVPVGKNIPLVIQLGKWRRQVTIPEVKECVETKLTDPNQTRLPKNQGEGNMPKVAVTTGGCDQLSCMLPKVGIDASEFGVAGSSKAIHFYNGSGGQGPSGAQPAQNLWNNAAKLKEYDIAIFSCECQEAPSTKNATSFAAVNEYLNSGGRIFTTDFQYLWYKSSPDPQMSSVGPIPGGAPTGGNPVKLKTDFPKGKALADWLKFTYPAGTYGEVRCDYVFDNFNPFDPKKSQTWATSAPGFGGGGTSDDPRFVTINTPVGKPIESQCGKAVHLDAHINQTDRVDTTFPAGCKASILQGELAFAFFFFDLASCIQKEDEPPPKPPIK